MARAPGPALGDYTGILATRYAGDHSFVHPDIGFLARILRGRSAFLARGQAKAFAARDGSGAPTAFAVAFVDPGLQAKVARPVASIGFFEALDEHSACQVLDVACEWLAARGATEVWAPFNGNPYNRMGVREDRFEEPPFVGCAHDPPTTRSYLRAAGFSLLTRYLNFEIDLASRPWRGAGPPSEGICMRPVSRLHFRNDVLSYVHLHNAAFRSVWGEVEISDAEALQLLLRSRLALDPRLVQFAVADGRDVGFVLCMPDLGEALAPLHAPLTSPAGLAKLARSRRHTTSVGLLSLGVDPDLQGRGVGRALVSAACRGAAALGYRRLEYALVAESNEPSKALAARFGGRQCRTFGIYARHLA